MNNLNAKKQRFLFIDQFRGLIVILMLEDHTSYYFNAIWKQIDPLDPLFDSWGQFVLRYLPYLCAPGFLMIFGTMTWWSFQRRKEKGEALRSTRWYLVKRGLFLVLLQVTWVNSSWGGFREFQPWHLGIIACIGISMILLSLIIHWNWRFLLLTGFVLLLAHPLLYQISYDQENVWQRVIMQTFIDAGSFNKYPVLPWFGLAILGAVMGRFWLEAWQSDHKKIINSLLIALLAIMLAVALRLGRGYGNIFPFSSFGSLSFFTDQKYPPSLFMNLWFFAFVLIGVSGFIALGKYLPWFMEIFSIPGRVPLFFYGVHIALMGILVKRTGWFYREGAVTESLIGFAIMMLVMYPLCIWFYRVKMKSNNFIIRMI